MKSRTVLVALLGLAVPIVAAGPTFAAAQPERWRGEVDLSTVGGTSLELFVTFVESDDGSVSATISIPAQGAEDLPLTDVVYGPERIEFTLAAGSAPAVFGADREGDAATGTLHQGGAELPLRMDMLTAEEEAGPSRPQHPRPPFPYEVEEVRFTNPADGAVLAGTLTVPADGGPHPAAALISGSGPQDRDETIFGHKPFLVLADALTRSGIAVLRFDDRGVGESTGPVEGITTADLAGDALAAVRALAERPEVDGTRIGLVGHSEGGLIAPMVAARAPGEVAFLVLLAGTGVSGAELMPVQLAALQRAAGTPEENVRRQTRAQQELIAAILAAEPEARVREAVTELVDVQLENLPPAQRDPEVRRQTIETAVRQTTSAWYRSFLATDPAEWLREVECPVLALNGSRDLQVPPELNLPRIEAALEAGGNDRVTVRQLAGLNHLFQSAESGHVAEYGRIEETFDPAALEVIIEWVQAVTASSGGGGDDGQRRPPARR